MVLPCAAAALCFLASRQAAEPRERWAWRFFAAAYTAGAWGEALWLYQRLAGGDLGPSPTASDVAWLAYYPLVLAALALLAPRHYRGLASLTSILDAFLFTLGPAGLYWWLVVQPDLAQASDPLAAAVNFIWPVGDLAITFTLVVLVSRWNLARVPWWLLYFFSAFVIQVLADALGATFQTQRRLDPLAPLDPLYSATYALVALAAVSRLHPWEGERLLDLARAHTARLFFPYLALPAVGLLLLLEFSQGIDSDTPQVLFLVAAVVALVLLRQLLTVLENSRLSDTLAALSEELERRVKERTAELAQRTGELAAVNRVATQLSHCLSLEDVLDTGLDLACEALRAPAGAIWFDRGDGRVELAAHHGFDATACRVLADPVRHGQALGGAIATGSPVHLRAEAVLAGPAGATWDFGARPCLIVVPLLSRRAVLGALVLAGRPEGVGEGEVPDLCVAIGAELGVSLENARRFENVRDLADRDPLTGLLNRRALDEQLAREIKRAARSGSPLSVLVIDVDSFKVVNDTRGHSVGDAVLSWVARLLRETCRGTDTIGRFGGDEFVIIAPDTPTAGAVTIGERLRRQAAGTREEWGGPPVGVHLSVGVATYPWDAQDGRVLMDHADANLYRSKEAGGNTTTASARPADQPPPLSAYRPRRQSHAEGARARTPAALDPLASTPGVA